MMAEGTGGSRFKPSPTRRGRRRRSLATGLLGLVVILALVLVIGFARFAAAVTDTAAQPDPGKADGITVFTGGQDRIGSAIALLSKGLARRLLISGVHPDTTEAAIASLAGVERTLFTCCIDLGHDARNTIGNAEETAAWARAKGFRNLIVVTSSYHMPRSLAELSRAMPEARLQGYAIAPASLNLSKWWREPETVGLLASEYVKLLAAELRLAASVVPGGATNAASRP